MTKRCLILLGTIPLVTNFALAADLPSRRAPPVYVPPPISGDPWTGAYVGLNAGYEFSGSNSFNTVGVPQFGANAGGVAEAFGIAGSNTTNLPTRDQGFIGGGQIGYNKLFATSYVAGLEADIQGLSARGNAQNIVIAPVPGFPAETFDATNTVSKRLNYFGTVRGRIGYLVVPTVLAYATGGLAYGGVKAGFASTTFDAVGLPPGTLPASGASSTSRTKAGYAVGGGVEWMFAPNLSLKAEYLYYDLGSLHPSASVVQNDPAVGLSPFAISNANSSTRFNGSVVRVGLNYHLNFTPPVVARY